MNPVLVEVVRGGHVESAHRGAVAVIDATGSVALELGNVTAAVYPRSVVKPLQALPLVSSGAADRLRLTDAEIALACGSHAGLPLHGSTVTAMLAKAGCGPACLKCGVHWPLDEQAGNDLAAGGFLPTAIHNNCSGKHAGLLCLSCFRGYDPADYTRPDHPAMEEMTTALSAMLEEPLGECNRGIDGCSIPTYAVPLRSLATGFSRFATGRGLPEELALAAARVRRAMCSHPEMIAGPGRFDTRIIAAYGDAILLKSGAEGVACAAIPAAALGIAVKIDDGASRAAEVVMATLLQRFLGEAGATRASNRNVLDDLARPAVRNWNGTIVGTVQCAKWAS
jgi:L-asparaginase II